MKRIAVVYVESKSHMSALLGELRGWIARFGWEASFVNARAPESLDGAELVVVMGGDGTFLAAARMAMEHDIPLLGVDLGRLGFLSEVAFNDLPAAFERIEAGDFNVEDRCMLNIAAFRGDEHLGTFHSLNDGVISKGAFARLVELATYVDGAYLTTYNADGLIVSTPTGSTAYALSAGGPLLTPDLPVLVISPICPHSLSARPIVVSDACDIRVIIEGPPELDLLLSADGQPAVNVHMGDHICFTKSPHRARLVKINKIDFFSRLQTKLNWGTTRRPG
jgi:NAD+ kinase